MVFYRGEKLDPRVFCRGQKLDPRVIYQEESIIREVKSESVLPWRKVGLAIQVYGSGSCQPN
jgi:hypothetical protein